MFQEEYRKAYDKINLETAGAVFSDRTKKYEKRMEIY